jgi:hypothetical protein
MSNPKDEGPKGSLVASASVVRKGEAVIEFESYVEFKDDKIIIKKSDDKQVRP